MVVRKVFNNKSLLRKFQQTLEQIILPQESASGQHDHLAWQHEALLHASSFYSLDATGAVE